MLSWFKRAKCTMTDSSQIQKAGAGASQLQVGVLNVGIDEKRAREICDEKISDAISDLTAEAFGVAKERVEDLVTMTLSKIQKQKADMSFFADPKFQREIAKAQSSAASSARKSDIEMLSELLVARMDGKLQRKTHTGISRAIEIVSDVDDDELTALTIVFAFGNFRPTPILGISLAKGLTALEGLYASLGVQALPKGEGWMENLNMLDAIVLSPFGEFKRVVDYYAEVMDGYVCVGIDKKSPSFINAQQILVDVGLPVEMLIPNELMTGYVRLPLVKQSECAEWPNLQSVPEVLDRVPNGLHVALADVQVAAMKEVLSLYVRDQSLMKQVKKTFEVEWQRYPSLVVVQKWIDGLKKSFDITKVGRALAYTNARRCAPGLPALNLEEF